MNEKLAVSGGKKVVPDGMIEPWPDIRQEDKDAVMKVLDRSVLWGATAPEVSSLQKKSQIILALNTVWQQIVGQQLCIWQ